MAKGKLVLNRKNIRELLRSQELAADLKQRADRIAQAAGPGHESSSYIGKTRARASVITTTRAAAQAEAENGNLSKSAGAGRG